MEKSKQSISVLIADDEPTARDVLKHFLSQEQGFEVIAESQDGEQALGDIVKHRPDLVFLDIEMPELSGIELVGLLEPPYPVIVFVTAYNEFAVKAFEENALDYILKPFDLQRFQKSLERVKAHFSAKTKPDADVSLDSVHQLFDQLSKDKARKYLKKVTVKHNGKIRFIPVDQIKWIESEGSFCKLHLQQNFALSNLPIKRLAELLDPSTHIRIHKSHMVNIDEIETIEPYFHGEYMINLTGGKTLKLSRGYKDKLGHILNQYK